MFLKLKNFFKALTFHTKVKFTQTYKIKLKKNQIAKIKVISKIIKNKPNSFFLNEVANLYTTSFASIYLKNQNPENFTVLKNEWREEIKKTWISNKKLNAKYILATINKKLIGIAVFLDDLEEEYQAHNYGFKKIKKILSSNEKYCSWLFIDPKAQGLGLAKALILTIKQIYPKTKKIVLCIDKKNQQSYNFYTHIGFHEIKYHQEKIIYDTNKTIFMYLDI